MAVQKINVYAYNSIQCDMTHSYVRHDSFIRATWLIHMCHSTNSLKQRCIYTPASDWVRHIICIRLFPQMSRITSGSFAESYRMPHNCTRLFAQISMVYTLWGGWHIHYVVAIGCRITAHVSLRKSAWWYIHYGVATVSNIDKIIGLFCRILSLS